MLYQNIHYKVNIMNGDNDIPIYIYLSIMSIKYITYYVQIKYIKKNN